MSGVFPKEIEINEEGLKSFVLQAIGFQVYVAKADARGNLEWSFKCPDAELYELGKSVVIGRHYQGPAWEDGSSKVVGRLEDKVRAPNPSDDIPWLKFSAKRRRDDGNGLFGNVNYIQRINTAGGFPPPFPPQNLDAEARVPYKAEFRFFSPDDDKRIAIREEGYTEILRLHAVGVQIYTAAYSQVGKAGLEWTFKAPEANLFDMGDKNHSTIIGTHYGGPTWKDGESEVVGQLIDRMNSPNPTEDIPWLKLSSKSREGFGIFGRTHFIQRINTHGGLAPSTGPTYLGEEVRVSYTADYRFFGLLSEEEDERRTLKTIKSVMAIRELSGYAEKKGHVFKNWKKRWFEFSIQPDIIFLHYFEDETLLKHKGRIPLIPGLTRLVLSPVTPWSHSSWRRLHWLEIDNGNLPRSQDQISRAANEQTYLKMALNNEADKAQWAEAIRTFTTIPSMAPSLMTQLLFYKRYILTSAEKEELLNKTGMTQQEFQTKSLLSILRKFRAEESGVSRSILDEGIGSDDVLQRLDTSKETVGDGKGDEVPIHSVIGRPSLIFLKRKEL